MVDFQSTNHHHSATLPSTSTGYLSLQHCYYLRSLLLRQTLVFTLVHSLIYRQILKEMPCHSNHNRKDMATWHPIASISKVQPQIKAFESRPQTRVPPILTAQNLLTTLVTCLHGMPTTLLFPAFPKSKVQARSKQVREIDFRQVCINHLAMAEQEETFPV